MVGQSLTTKDIIAFSTRKSNWSDNTFVQSPIFTGKTAHSVGLLISPTVKALAATIRRPRPLAPHIEWPGATQSYGLYAL